MTIRVLVVDDQALIRSGFRLVLNSTSDIRVVGEAVDGGDAVSKVAAMEPDVVLMDVRMPVVDGVEATRRLSEAGAGARVLILTTFDLDEYAFAALRAGASGFLLKDVPPEELCAAIRAVARGDAVVSPRVTRELLNRYSSSLPSSDDDRHPGLESLTSREREVLLELAAGRSNAEIAEQLVLSEATVKTHVTRILAKLELRDRVQVVVFAHDRGLRGP